jgi:hypothetical protein
VTERGRPLPACFPLPAGKPQPPPHRTWAEHRAGRRGCHRAKRGKGSVSDLDSPVRRRNHHPSPVGRARPGGALGGRFVRFFRTSSTLNQAGTSRPRRSHANDVNPAQRRDVHKRPAHKRLLQQRDSSAARDRLSGEAAISGCGASDAAIVFRAQVASLKRRRGSAASTRVSCARFRGEPVVRCPIEAIVRRPTSISRGSTCASSGLCSRPPAHGPTAECVALR